MVLVQCHGKKIGVFHAFLYFLTDFNIMRYLHDNKYNCFMIFFMNHIGENYHITVLSNRPEETRAKYHIDVVYRFSIREVLNLLSMLHDMPQYSS